MLKSKNFLIILAVVSALVACEKSEVSFETQEQSRAAALENATFNANVWRNANKPELKIMMRGDSTIGPSCNTGDGWATVDLVTETGAHVVKLKCSTVSPTIGCMTESDFKARPDYAEQDGHCNRHLPFPLQKIVK